MCYCVDVDVRKSNPFPGTNFTNIFYTRNLQRGQLRSRARDNSTFFTIV